MSIEIKQCSKCGDARAHFSMTKLGKPNSRKCNRCCRERSQASAAYYREYRKKHPHFASTNVGRWQKNNPHKTEVHRLVKNAVSRGQIKKMPCEKCGEERVDAHHSDYEKPFLINWLCRKHHKEAHLQETK